MRASAAVFLCAAASSLAWAQPAWFLEAATAAHPAYAAKVTAVELLREETVVMVDERQKTRTIRFALKVLNREGAQQARQFVPYVSKGTRVREVRAWLLMPSGRTKEYGKPDLVDVAYMSGVYDEMRTVGIDGRRDADPGAVFGFEATMEERSAFTQFQYAFQGELPVLRSSFTLSLPASWRAEGVLLGGSSIQPEVGGTTYRWKLADLKPIEPEPDSPDIASLAPRLAVSTFPGDRVGLAARGFFANWRDVSKWVSELVDPASTLTPGIELRVQSLSAAAADFWPRLQSLAGDAQRLRYVSIQLNLARGGGYTPHAADEVLRNAYGDCKDKANYLRALLKAANIDSYPVAIYSGDPLHTKKEWPSPTQFNHMILAIKVPEDTLRPAAFTYPGLGRLMLFDPTDSVVPIGMIPGYLQKANALLLAGDRGDLFETPSTAASGGLVKREVRFKLTEKGDMVNAVVRESSSGEAAFTYIRRESDMNPNDVDQRWRKIVGALATGGAISKLERKVADDRANFHLAIDLDAPGYAKIMQNRLFIFKPVFLPLVGIPDVSAPKRNHAVVVDALAFQETVEVELPAGLAVDEIPDEDAAEVPYGRYRAKWRHENGKVYFERELVLDSTVVPASEYRQLRDFVGRIRGGEQTPVVLVRQ